MLKKMKKFIITVDTEGDNLWAWKQGAPITTRNAKFIPRFQMLCEKYGLKPTYLTNYEMANDEEWVQYAKQKARAELCEIGLHIHAWNSPPDYLLSDVYHGNSYITEYPDDVIINKVAYLTELLSVKFDTSIVSSRSGRWATNEIYFKALVQAGIKVDCSVTPEIDLSMLPGCNKNIGNDYSKYSKQPHIIYPGLFEIPMTTRRLRWDAPGTIKHKLKVQLFGEDMWLRPHKLSMEYLMSITKSVEAEEVDYLEFMIHSSELMPGGSPYFKNDAEIEKLYELLECYFSYMNYKGYKGCTLEEYYRLKVMENGIN